MAHLTRSRRTTSLATSAFWLTILVLTVLLAVPGVTHASAYGIQYWTKFNVTISGNTIGVPAGQLAHLIEGKGLYITTDGANFASAANLCDTSMRFTYGNGSQKIDGNVHWGCSKVGQWKYALNRNMPRGDACAELWAKNWQILVARQCHYVTGK